MVLSDAEKLGIAETLACLMHLVVVPRQDEGRMEMQHPAKRLLAEACVHLVVMIHQKVLGEGETSLWSRVPELGSVNLYQQRAREDSRPEGAAIPVHKRRATFAAHWVARRSKRPLGKVICVVVPKSCCHPSQVLHPEQETRYR